MPLSICGVHEVPSFANSSVDHIISFHEAGVEPGTGFQPGPDITQFKHPFTLHSFVCRDCGQPNEPEPPTEAMMRRLLAVYAQTGPDSRMLFHCFAGVSRSTAAAFLWLIHIGATDAQAFDTIVAARGPGVNPNRLMILLADKILGRGGKMLEYVCQRRGDLEYLKSPAALLLSSP